MWAIIHQFIMIRVVECIFGVSSLFRQVYIFRQVDIPTGRYSDRSISRQVVIPTGLYSDRSIFRQVSIPVCGDLGLRRSRPGWSRPVRGDLARWSRPVRGDLARWSRPVRGDLARWSRPVSCPRCEHATTSQAPQAPLHVRRSSPEISPGDLARSLIADTSPIPWRQQLTR